MTATQQATAAASLAAAAALCFSLVLVVKSRRNRATRVERTSAAAGATRRTTWFARKNDQNTTSVVDRGEDSNAVGRRPPGSGQVFALYGDGESDAEPSTPPMALSEEVLDLLKSFDVDPVRGELGCFRALTVRSAAVQARAVREREPRVLEFTLNTTYL